MGDIEFVSYPVEVRDGPVTKFQVTSENQIFLRVDEIPFVLHLPFLDQ